MVGSSQSNTAPRDSMQEAAAANTQAKLLCEELVLEKQAVKQALEDLRAHQQHNKEQIARIRASKFPAAQVRLRRLRFG